MCWKEEWAKAYNNLNRASFHVARAGMKLEIRAEKVRSTLSGWESGSGHRRSEAERQRLQEIWKKYVDGAEKCRELVKTFQEAQETLENLIDELGISHMKGRSKMLERLMHPHYDRWGKAKEWADTRSLTGVVSDRAFELHLIDGLPISGGAKKREP